MNQIVSSDSLIKPIRIDHEVKLDITLSTNII